MQAKHPREQKTLNKDWTMKGHDQTLAQHSLLS